MNTGQSHGFGHALLVIAASEYRRNKAKWLAARRSGLGATDTSAILGLSSYATALDVYLDKTSAAAPEDSASDQAMAGQMLETPVARRTIRENPELGKLVPTPGLLAHPEFHWLMATPDFGLAARGSKEVTALLEVKTTQENVYRKTWLGDVPPHRILIQAQQQLLVTGLQTCWVTCMRRDSGRMAPLYRVERSERVAGQIIGYAGAWWAHHIIEGVAPDPVFRDLDKLAELFPADESLEPLPATPELLAAIRDLAGARIRSRVAKADEDAAKLVIESALAGGQTAIADAAGDVLVTWKPMTERRLDQARLAKDHPGLLEQYKTPRTRRGSLLIIKEDS
jgi:putative phage-type endonuclease